MVLGFWESVTVVLLLKLGKEIWKFEIGFPEEFTIISKGCRLLATSVPLKKMARFFE